MKSEKEIIEQLSEYEWFYNFIVETPETEGYIRALKWVLGVGSD